MTRLLVDTSAYSAFLRGHRDIVEAITDAVELCLTPVVLGELLAGFRKGSRYDENVERLERFMASPRAAWLTIDDETAHRYSILQDHLRRAGEPIPTNHLWIAASATQHGLRLLTTDPHFERLPQIVVNRY